MKKINQLDFPELFLEQLSKTKIIFLSVSPIIIYSDILSSIDEYMAKKGTPLEIISLENLESLAVIKNKHVLIICGDIFLKELPSRIRYSIAEKKIDYVTKYISDDPWLALRVSSPMSSSSLNFEFLSSTALPAEAIDICDISWTNTDEMKKRFESTVYCEKKTIANVNTIIDTENLEFIE